MGIGRKDVKTLIGDGTDRVVVVVAAGQLGDAYRGLNVIITTVSVSVFWERRFGTCVRSFFFSRVVLIRDNNGWDGIE